MVPPHPSARPSQANFRAAAAALMHLAEVLLDTFRMEESVMCLLQYPRLADHVASHRLFLLQVGPGPCGRGGEHEMKNMGKKYQRNMEGPGRPQQNGFGMG